MMYSVACTPSTTETNAAFRKMILEPVVEQPIVEMNDETARDIDIIWRSILALTSTWRGNRDFFMPDEPIHRKEFWGKFAVSHKPLELPVASAYIEQVDGTRKLAIDLGCGNSPATKQLLQKGWRVIAVDYSQSALDALKAHNSEAIQSGQLTVIEADVVTFTPPQPADLVVAADIFPYIDPSQFQATWKKIHAACLKKNGILIGTFFRSVPSRGPFMNVMKEMGAWFLPDRRMVRALLAKTGYEVSTCIYRQDSEQQGEAACIQFVAKKVSKCGSSSDNKE